MDSLEDHVVYWVGSVDAHVTLNISHQHGLVETGKVSVHNLVVLSQDFVRSSGGSAHQPEGNIVVGGTTRVHDRVAGVVGVNNNVVGLFVGRSEEGHEAVASGVGAVSSSVDSESLVEALIC